MKRHPIGIYLLCAILVGGNAYPQNGYQYDSPTGKSNGSPYTNGNGARQNGNGFGLKNGYQNGALSQPSNGFQNGKKPNTYQNGQPANGGYQNGQYSNGKTNGGYQNGQYTNGKTNGGYQNGQYTNSKTNGGYQNGQYTNVKSNGYQNGQYTNSKSNGYQNGGQSRPSNGYQNGNTPSVNGNGYQNGRKTNGYNGNGQYNNGYQNGAASSNGYQYKRPPVNFDSSSSPSPFSYSTPSQTTFQQQTFQQTDGGETTIQDSFQQTSFSTSEAPTFTVTNGNGVSKSSLSQTYASFSQEATTLSPGAYGDTSPSDLSAYTQGNGNFYGGGSSVTQGVSETTGSPASGDFFPGGNTGSEEALTYTASTASSPGPSNNFGSQGPTFSPAGPTGFTPSGAGGVYTSPGFVPGNSGNQFNAKQTSESEDAGDYSAIPGKPDTDYPILSQITRTSFSCAAQKSSGYYADVEARCQVFHVCHNGLQYDFLCPNGTIFSQMHLVCVWWNQFDCNSSPSLYSLNEEKFQGGKMQEIGPQTNVDDGLTKQGFPGGAPGGTQSTFGGPYGGSDVSPVSNGNGNGYAQTTSKPGTYPAGPSGPYDSSAQTTEKPNNEENYDASVDSYTNSNYENQSTVNKNYPYQQPFSAPNREYLPPYGKRR